MAVSLRETSELLIEFFGLYYSCLLNIVFLVLLKTKSDLKISKLLEISKADYAVTYDQVLASNLPAQKLRHLAVEKCCQCI